MFNKKEYNAFRGGHIMHTSQKLEQLIYELFQKLYLEKRNSGQISQGKILKILYKKGDISQKEMQGILNVKSGTISEYINKLENKELLVRKNDENDRRKRVLHLTDKGKKDVEAFTDDYKKEVMQLFSVLSDNEKLELERILKKLLMKDGE